MVADTQRYTAVAIALHWLIATAVLLNLGLGWWMHEAIGVNETRSQAVSAFQVHKSLGLTVLVLSVLRLLWRLTHTPPAPPAHVGRALRFAATLVHALLYLCMVVVPLTGWLLVSTQWRHDAPLQVPTLWFGLFEVPHLFGLNEASAAERAAWSRSFFSAHELLANLMALLAIGHIGAAVYHHFGHRDGVLARMLPVGGDAAQRYAARPARDRAVLWFGRIAVITLLAVVGISLQVPSQPTPAAPVAARIESSGAWAIDPLRSEIRFSGSHAGNPFTGSFSVWRVAADFDVMDPSISHVDVVIDTSSARTGIALNDQTLRETEWFDVENHPQARFVSTAIRAAGGGLWHMDGELTIKARTVSVSGLELRLANDAAAVTGDVEIDRTAVDLGMDSDPTAEWVSQTIAVSVAAFFARKTGAH